MQTDIELFHEALKKVSFNSSRHFEALRPENQEFLQKHFPSQALLDFFSTFSFDGPVSLENVYFDQANDFHKEFTWEESFRQCVQAQLLPVGSGLNGDPIVWDSLDEKMGFLNHDIFWEEEVPARSCLIKLNCSIGQFFLNAVTLEEYPADSYEAAEYESHE